MFMTFHRYIPAPLLVVSTPPLTRIVLPPVDTFVLVIFWLTGTFVRVSLSFRLDPDSKEGFMFGRHDTIRSGPDKSFMFSWFWFVLCYILSH